MSETVSPNIIAGCLKITLSILAGCALFFLGFHLKSEQVRSEQANGTPELPFKVIRYADRESGAIESATGIPAPFSVLVYERRIHKVVPGFVAPIDDEVWIKVPKETLDKQ